jgi:hypothetical protein
LTFSLVAGLTFPKAAVKQDAIKATGGISSEIMTLLLSLSMGATAGKSYPGSGHMVFSLACRLL